MLPGGPYDPGGQGEPTSHAAAVTFCALGIPVVPGVHGEPKQLVAPAELYVPGTQFAHTPALVAEDKNGSVP